MHDPYVCLISYEEGNIAYYPYSMVVYALMELTDRSHDQIVNDLMRSDLACETMPDLPEHGHWVAGDVCSFLGSYLIIPLYQSIDAMEEVGEPLVASKHIRETSID